ncbi:inosine/xanthosine triphosphatase [Batrachochytrium salamandrivorans]|nr:inosine/xanthosine triphosphatase [Batrachochytrium salamandrivorans]
MHLDEIEKMEENSEFIARNLEEVGQARSAANFRTKAQAEAMRKRNGSDENTLNYYFKVGDMVKMKHHDRQKLEFNWKGPYHVVDVGHPGTYWIMTPQGLRLPNAINQADLAPWLAPVIGILTFSTMGQIETHLWIRKGLGTTNAAKLRASQMACSQIFASHTVVVEGISVESGVSDQPLSDIETIQGAKTRAKAALEARPDAHYALGIEGGAQQIGDRWFEAGWIAVLDHNGQIGLGSSGRYELSEVVMKKLLAGQELADVIDELSGLP